MNRILLGVATVSLALANAANAAISAETLAARHKGQAASRLAKDASARDATQPRVSTQADRPAESITPNTDSANEPRRPLPAGPIREASAAGPWSPSSPLPSTRDVDSILPPDDNFTTHGTGTRPPPPLGRTWDPSRETYNEWYARVIQGTSADPATYPNAGPTTGPTTGNSSTSTSGSNQWGEWAYDNDVSVIGRVFLPDGTTPGVGFSVYIVPVFLNPPFPMPSIRTYTDADGYFYADLWASGVWHISVVRNTPETEARLVYFTFTYDRMYAGDEPNTFIMVTRLAGSWR